MSSTDLIVIAFYSGSATALICLLGIPFCRKLGLVDFPNERKHHVDPTPLAGGLTLLVAVLPAVVISSLLLLPEVWIKHLLVWIAAVAAMTLVGLADDRHTVSARDRLLLSFLVFGSTSTLDPMFNVRVLNFEYPEWQLGLGTGWLAAIFTTICCVGLVNAINMADGKNGLVIGLCIAWLSLLFFRAPSPIMAVIISLVAAWIMLLVFNLRGKLFLGDGGSYGIATGIGLLAILIYNSEGEHAGRAISADELMILFSIPVVDSFRLTLMRLYRGRSPMSPDRDHLHHHLLEKFGWPGGLLFYWIFALTPLFIHLTGLMSLAAIILVICIYFYFVAFGEKAKG